MEMVRERLFSIYKRLGDIAYAVDDLLVKYDETSKFDDEWLKDLRNELKKKISELHLVASESKSKRKELFDIYERLNEILHGTDSILRKYEETGKFNDIQLELLRDKLQHEGNKLYAIALETEDLR